MLFVSSIFELVVEVEMESRTTIHDDVFYCFLPVTVGRIDANIKGGGTLVD